MNRFYIASLIAAFSIAPATANAADISSAAKVQTTAPNGLLNGTSHIAINGVLDDRSFQRRTNNSGQRARSNGGQRARGNQGFRRNASSNRGSRSEARSNRQNRQANNRRSDNRRFDNRQANTRQRVIQEQRNNRNVQERRDNVRNDGVRSNQGVRNNRDSVRNDRGFRNNRDSIRNDRGFRNNRNVRNDRGFRNNRRYNANNQYFFNGRFHNRWRNDWRRFDRYDFRSFRKRNNSIFRLGFYTSPFRSHRYSRFGIGGFLGSAFFHSNYWINNPSYYRLPPAYGAYRWVRYYNDVFLVDIRDGYIADIEYGFFF